MAALTSQSLNLLQDCLGEIRPIEPLGLDSPGCNQPGAQLGFFGDPLNRTGQPGGVIRIDKQSGLSSCFDQSCTPAADHRAATVHRFDHRQAKAFKI